MKLIYTLPASKKRLGREYQTVKNARRNGRCHYCWSKPVEQADEFFTVVLVDTENLEPAEMTDEQSFEWHERQMLRHAELAETFRAKLSKAS